MILMLISGFVRLRLDFSAGRVNEWLNRTPQEPDSRNKEKKGGGSAQQTQHEISPILHNFNKSEKKIIYVNKKKYF